MREVSTVEGRTDSGTGGGYRATGSAAAHSVHVVIEGSAADLLLAAAPHRIAQVTTHEPDLEEIFLDYYRKEA